MSQMGLVSRVTPVHTAVRSERDAPALAAAKRRGVKLGGDRGARLTAKARAAGRAVVKERARNQAMDLASPLISHSTRLCF
jgi:hypothetical protein